MGFVIILSLVLLNSIPNIDMIVLNFRVQETNTSGIVIHHVAGLGRHRLHIICVRMNGQKEPSRHICRKKSCWGFLVSDTPLEKHCEGK